MSIQHTWRRGCARACIIALVAAAALCCGGPPRGSAGPGQAPRAVAPQHSALQVARLRVDKGQLRRGQWGLSTRHFPGKKIRLLLIASGDQRSVKLLGQVAASYSVKELPVQLVAFHHDEVRHPTGRHKAAASAATKATPQLLQNPKLVSQHRLPFFLLRSPRLKASVPSLPALVECTPRGCEVVQRCCCDNGRRGFMQRPLSAQPTQVSPPLKTTKEADEPEEPPSLARLTITSAGAIAGPWRPLPQSIPRPGRPGAAARARVVRLALAASWCPASVELIQTPRPGTRRLDLVAFASDERRSYVSRLVKQDLRRRWRQEINAYCGQRDPKHSLIYLLSVMEFMIRKAQLNVGPYWQPHSNMTPRMDKLFRRMRSRMQQRMGHLRITPRTSARGQGPLAPRPFGRTFGMLNKDPLQRLVFAQQILDQDRRDAVKLLLKGCAGCAPFEAAYDVLIRRLQQQSALFVEGWTHQHRIRHHLRWIELSIEALLKENRSRQRLDLLLRALLAQQVVKKRDLLLLSRFISAYCEMSTFRLGDASSLNKSYVALLMPQSLLMQASINREEGVFSWMALDAVASQAIERDAQAGSILARPERLQQVTQPLHVVKDLPLDVESALQGYPNLLQCVGGQCRLTNRCCCDEVLGCGGD